MNLTQTFASVVASSQIDANNIEPTVNNPAVATGAFSTCGFSSLCLCLEPPCC